MFDFDAWDLDNPNMAQEVEEQAKNFNNGEFEPLPYGNYEVYVRGIEVKPTKKENLPMAVIEFEVINGSYKGRRIWVNRVIDTPVKINMARGFIDSLFPKTENPHVEYKSMSQFANDIINLGNVSREKYDYMLKFEKNDKGYDVYKIDDIFVTQRSNGWTEVAESIELPGEGK